jgi:hypothetical protein
VLSQRVGYAIKLGYRKPGRLLRKLRQRLASEPEKHMHRFDVGDLESMLEAAAFQRVEASGPIKKRVFAFQAAKPSGPSREAALAALQTGG